MASGTVRAPFQATTPPSGLAGEAGAAGGAEQPVEEMVGPAPTDPAQLPGPEPSPEISPEEATMEAAIDMIDIMEVDGTTTPEDDLPCDARGLKLAGLQYSPGGTRLPHPCEPFHPTLNNPFAVRCVDAWPWYATGFPGDELCILPPEPGKGIQYGVHPQGADWYSQVSTGDMSGYGGASIPNGFVVPPGEEDSGRYRTRAQHESESRAYYRSHVRVRTGALRMFAGGDQDLYRLEEWAGEGTFLGPERLPYALRPDENLPMTLDKPDEDAGLHSILSSPTATIEVHYFNPTNDNMLKETWTNLWFDDDASMRMEPFFGLAFGQVAQTFARPGETVDAHYSWSIVSDVRLLDLIAHRRMWTSNFSVWLEDPDGGLEVLYQSFDWRDPPRYRFDSLTDNPVPDPQGRTDGASSGTRILKAGQTLHFNCHMEFTQQRAASEGAPDPSTLGALRFAQSSAQRGAICILFGTTAGGMLMSPDVDPSPVPDFAVVE